ncbi:MAG: hypothetical protein ABRQ26_13755 [Syntrophomonadaceae bacterium]
MKKGFRRILVILTVFVILFALTGCGGNNSSSTNSGQTSSGSSQQTKSNPDKVLKAGEAATLEGMEITLVNATVPKNVSADGEYKYVVVRYKVKNTATRDLQWENKTIYWFDNTLAEKKMSIKNTGVKTASESGIVPAGASGEFEAVYKVALSLNSIDLRYYSSPDTPYRARWMIDITK